MSYENRDNLDFQRIQASTLVYRFSCGHDASSRAIGCSLLPGCKISKIILWKSCEVRFVVKQTLVAPDTSCARLQELKSGNVAVSAVQKIVTSSALAIRNFFTYLCSYISLSQNDQCSRNKDNPVLSKLYPENSQNKRTFFNSIILKHNHSIHSDIVFHEYMSIYIEKNCFNYFKDIRLQQNERLFASLK